MFKYGKVSHAQKNHKNIMSNFDRDKISLEHLLWFINERESIRKGKQTEDYILKHSKFCNIRREDDKTTRFLFDTLGHLSGLELWSNLVLSRFINRIDTLRNVLVWNMEDLSWLLQSPFTNPYAYQLSSSLVKNRDYSTVREVIVYEIPNKVEDTFKAGTSSNALGKATKAANKAFGGGAEFVFYQIILDYAQITGAHDLMSDDIIHGTGSRDIAPLIDTSSIDMAPYEIENVLCEYRKYLYQSKRLEEGKKLSSPYFKGRYS